MMKTKLLIGILVIGIVFISGCIQPPTEEKPTPTLPPTLPPTPTTPQPTAPEKPKEVAEVPPIVEEKEIPEQILNNCIGFLIGTDAEITTVKEIGAGWIRPHPGSFSWNAIERSKGNYDFSVTDGLVKIAQENEVAILATIWPFAEWDQKICRPKICEVGPEDEFYPRDPMGLLGIPKSRCKPCNMNDYEEFLKNLVERYDGDGQNDMPGLEIPIRYYELLNEPEMKEPFLTFFKGTKEEYVDILKASYKAIKEVCHDCKVVQGGAAGIAPDSLSYWSDVFDLGGSNYFDIANIHYVNAGDRSTLNVKSFKDSMDKKGIQKPIWVTEAEYGDNKDQEIETTVEGALFNGAQKIFFTRFVIGGTSPPIPGQYSKQYIEIASKCSLI